MMDNKGHMLQHHLVQHLIDTIKQQPYQTPVVQRDQIAQLIKQMQSQGIVKPSASPWASPVVLVPKKDSSIRFCIDYRCLNAVTKKDVNPLPHIGPGADKKKSGKANSKQLGTN